jgi:hypothetical protein
MKRDTLYLIVSLLMMTSCVSDWTALPSPMSPLSTSLRRNLILYLNVQEHDIAHTFQRGVETVTAIRAAWRIRIALDSESGEHRLGPGA